ncbi:MAG: hypothetical protein ACO1NQ_03390, partial [Flavobacteriales bacterium]
MIRSVFAYARSMAEALADPAARALVMAHRKPIRGEAFDQRAALRHAVGYLLRAQREGTDKGMGSFHLTKGWGASY